MPSRDVDENTTLKPQEDADVEMDSAEKLDGDASPASKHERRRWTTRELLFNFDLDNPETLPPVDGTVAWLIVVASFFVHVFMFGLSYSFSVYQRYYVSENSPFFNTPAEAASSNSLVSWVGSIQACCLFLFAPLTGRFADRFGYRTAIYTGLVLQAGGLFAASFATSIYHLFPTQGFMYGVGMCISYPPCVGAVAQWHKNFRGLAVGLAVSGAGIGGFAIGPLVQILIDGVGWRWSLRICALFVGGGAAIFGWMIVPRQRATPQKGFFNWRLLTQDWLFFRYFLSGFLMNFCYNVPWLFSATFVSTLGYSASLGALSVGVLNGASAVGRIVMGLTSDAVGPLNALAGSMTGAALSVLLIWTFSHNYGIFLVFCVIYGFCGGGFISLTPTAVAALYGTDGIASRMGMYYAGLPWGLLVSPPIAGAILDRNTQIFVDGTKSQNFVPSIMFVGAFLSAGTSVIWWIRFERAKYELLAKV